MKMSNRMLCSSLTSLALACVLHAQAPGEGVAFLDSRAKVVVALDTPASPTELQKRFRLQVGTRPVQIAAIKPAGEPEVPRLLPRTPGRVILPGTLQGALDGKDWDPDGESTQMTEVRPGVHELVVALNKGNYEYKIARNGSWAENYGANFEAGGQNISLTIAKDQQIVKFVVDFNQKTILNSIQHPDRVTAPSILPPRPLARGPLKYPSAEIVLAKPLDLSVVWKDLTLHEGAKTQRVIPRRILDDSAFTDTGKLGSFHSKEATTFRVWSPVASKADVLLHAGGKVRRVPMVRSPKGTWSATVKGDLHGTPYQYEFQSLGQTRVAADINCFAATKDATKSIVVDLSRTNPGGWLSNAPKRANPQTEAVIYEMHVRDFTIAPSSGVPEVKRGTYAGLVHEGTKYLNSPTGIDYLKWLGVTDIHLLPIQSFTFEGYSWGYGTVLFNVPEDSYSMTPNDPMKVIRETKEMVAGMHKAGLRVILDVVYNHTWPPEGKDSPFHQTVPFYYFHTNDRGQMLNESGVGNAVDDSRPMVKKFVKDSLLYWINDYKVDGFRFDLLGIHHAAAVREYAQAVRKVRPDAVLYGEPWTAAGPNRFPKGAQRSTGFAVFNDNFRGIFRGDLDGSNKGFAAGGTVNRASLERAIAGSIDSEPGKSDGFTDSPTETINYVSAHDNLTLLDRLGKSLTKQQEDVRAAQVATAAVLFSQGVPFLEGGVEIGRTKGGNHNSYNAGDAVNQFDWARAARFQLFSRFTKDAIAFRKANPAFRMTSAEEVRKNLRFLTGEFLPANSVAFTLRQGSEEILVILNGSDKNGTYRLPSGDWTVHYLGVPAPTFKVTGGNLIIDPWAVLVLKRPVN